MFYIKSNWLTKKRLFKCFDQDEIKKIFDIKRFENVFSDYLVFPNSANIIK